LSEPEVSLAITASTGALPSAAKPSISPKVIVGIAASRIGLV
jgi:hypothetical protein